MRSRRVRSLMRNFVPASRVRSRCVRYGDFRVWVILASLPLLCRGLSADVVVLKNGNEIQGEIVHENENHVTVSFPGGTLRLKRRQIREIQRQPRLVYLLQEGEKALRQRDYERAIATLTNATRESPDSERARAELQLALRSYASSLASLNRFEEALQVYRRILDETPGDGEASRGAQHVMEARAGARAAIESARQAMRHGDTPTGVERLRTIYDEFPDSRKEVTKDLSRACVRRARELSRRARWEEAAALLHSAATVDPEQVHLVRGPFVMCKINQAKPFLEVGDFSAIERIAREGLEIDPSNSQLNYFLALSRDAQGKGTEAAWIYASLLGESPRSFSQQAVAELRARVEREVIRDDYAFTVFLEEKAKEVLPGDFRTMTTKHFVIRHRNKSVGIEVRRVAETFYNDLFRRLGCTNHWRNPCEVIVYPTEELYQRDTGIGIWSGAAHELKRRRGVFSQQRIVTYQRQPGLTNGVLQHEIAHALLTHRLNYPRQIPLWANEGFAVCEGPGYLHTYYRQLVTHERRRQRLVPLSTIVTSESYPDDKDVALFYGESYTLVDYLLRRKGLGTFLALLKDLTQAGSSLEQELREHYGFRSLNAFENLWRGSL